MKLVLGLTTNNKQLVVKNKNFQEISCPVVIRQKWREIAEQVVSSGILYCCLKKYNGADYRRVWIANM